MSLLSVHEVSKTYGDKPLLRSVSLQIKAGERLALVGRNGAGKSTLMRILAGVEDMDAGERTVRRGLTIGMLEQDPTLDPDATIREVVSSAQGEHADVRAQLDAVHEEMASATEPSHLDKLLTRQARLEERLDALGGHDIEHKVLATIDKLGLPDPDAKCGPLSGGERRRVALARLLLGQPDLLLLDEPTNHLDAEVIDWLEDWLIGARMPLVLVTHDRYFLDRIVDKVVEVDRGSLHVYEGGYSGYLEGRAARVAAEAKQEQSRLNLLRRETEWMRRGPPARTSKDKGRIQRFHQLEDGAADAIPAELELQIPSGPRLGNVVIELHGIKVAFGDKEVLPGIDLEIGPGDRVGIIGPNGAGKSTLLRVATGQLIPDSGKVTIGETVQFAAIDQGRTNLDPERTVLDEVSDNNDYVFVGERPRRIEGFLDAFLFKGQTKHSLVKDLSGGERGRVLLAKLLSAGGNVLVLDEPTNDLDLETLRALEEALVAFPGAVIVVSHDRWFLDRVAQRIIAFRGNGRVETHESPLSLVLERWRKQERAQRDDRAKGTTTKDKGDRGRSKKPKLSSRERGELEGLPAQIEAGETRLAELDEALGSADLYADGADPDEPQRLLDERERLQGEVTAMYERWEALEAVREAEASG